MSRKLTLMKYGIEKKLVMPLNTLKLAREKEVMEVMDFMVIFNIKVILGPKKGLKWLMIHPVYSLFFNTTYVLCRDIFYYSNDTSHVY